MAIEILICQYPRKNIVNRLDSGYIIKLGQTRYNVFRQESIHIVHHQAWKTFVIAVLGAFFLIILLCA